MFRLQLISQISSVVPQHREEQNNSERLIGRNFGRCGAGAFITKLYTVAYKPGVKKISSLKDELWALE